MYTILISILVIVGFSLLYVYKSPEKYFLIARIYIFIEFVILTYFFSLYIKNKFVRKILFFSQVVFLIFCIYDFTIEKIPGIPYVPVSVAHITLLCFIIYFFFEIMQETVSEPIYLRAIFWISLAFIINTSGNFFLFLYARFNYDVNVFKTPQYTIIYTTVTILKNILLCISILLKEKHENATPNNLIDIDLDSFHPIKNKS